jgi:hypothetical protein
MPSSEQSTKLDEMDGDGDFDDGMSNTIAVLAPAKVKDNEPTNAAHLPSLYHGSRLQSAVKENASISGQALYSSNAPPFIRSFSAPEQGRRVSFQNKQPVQDELSPSSKEDSISHVKRTLSSSSLQDRAPNSIMPRASAKRKRSGEIQLVPEHQRIFNGLRFCRRFHTLSSSVSK